jgi:predicted DNA-binding transcriptional regulator YafY
MALNVCVDRALTSWILSFGPFARVTSPAALARDIAHQLGDALSQYAQAAETGVPDKATGP